MKHRLNSISGRQPDALLAGVCSGIAKALSWNVWVLRILFLGFLALKTLWAVGVYAVLAVLFHLLDEERRSDDKSTGLESPELSDRNRRIDELERQFRDLEQR